MTRRLPLAGSMVAATRLAAGLMLWLVGTMFAAQAAVLEVRRAEAVLAVGGQDVRREVALPYNWDREHRGQPGIGTFDLPFSLAIVPGQHYQLYFARLGNAYEVWINGVLLERRGDLQAFYGTDYGQVPRWVPVPANLLATENVLRVRIRADGGRRAGVPVPLIGPESEISTRFRQAHTWRSTASLVVVVLSLIVGTTALVLWLTQTDPQVPQQPRRDALYLYAAVAEYAWALRVGSVVTEEPPVPWPVWGTASALALGAWVTCMLAFCCIVAGWGGKRWVDWMLRVLWGILAAGMVMVFAALKLHLPWLLTLWYGALAVIGVPFAAYYLWSAARHPTPVRMVVAAVLALNAAVALRDWMVFRFGGAFGNDTFARYSSVLFGLTLGGIVIIRFSRATAQARDLLLNLGARVAQKEAELQGSFRQLEQLAREQERTAERTRVLRDMHDGVGSHLSAAIRQLQSGRSQPQIVLQTLRDALEQLKLSIDAMNLPPGDINALLAGMRYRLQPRFASSDLQLEWQVDEIPLIARLDSTAMRQLQFILFEAFSNVLQHAAANTLRVEAGPGDGGGARLRIMDDGLGFDPEGGSRGGVRAMRERAAAIGAVLAVRSRTGQTVVDILVPA